jgi:hypothetical protein
MSNPLNLLLSDRIEEIQAEIDELIDGRVDELGASAAGVPRDWIRQSLFARNGGLCRCKLATMILRKEEEKDAPDL